MSKHGPAFDGVIAAIDEANGQDPNRVEVAGRQVPAELVYGQRMSQTLARMAPDACEHLQIAARGQHIERWTSPRNCYPATRAGYLSWRNALKDYHARRVGEIMASKGYGHPDIARVAALIGKVRMRSDPDAQMLEDVVCVVFLEYYVSDFAAKTDQSKLGPILIKTWNKMSSHGHAHALGLELPPKVALLLARAVKSQ
jgi:hypothetical protein